MFESRPFPERFPQLVEILFPPPPAGSIAPQKIPFSIRDLLEEGFTIEPTDAIVEHLTLANKTVKILALNVEVVSELLSYSDNQAAAWVSNLPRIHDLLTLIQRGRISRTWS